MHRTDIFNRTNILLIILALLLAIAFWPRNKSEQKQTYDTYDPVVTEAEINFYLNNDIVVDKADQLSVQKHQNWATLQAQVGQLKSSLEYFKRLNMQKLIQKHNELKEKVESCRKLDFNKELNLLKINYDTMISTKDPQEQLTQLESDKEKLNNEIFYIKGQLGDLKNLQATLKQQQGEVSDSTAALKLQNREKSLGKLKEIILERKIELEQLKTKLDQKMSQGEDEDLTKYYQFDQEQAKMLGELFKPAKEVKNVNNLNDQKLKDFVSKFHQSIKSIGQPTDDYLNGLNFTPEMKKNDIEEMQSDYIKKLTILEQLERQQDELQTEINDLNRIIKSEAENLTRIMNQLEQLRKDQKNYEILQLQHQQSMSQVLNKIKNLRPLNKNENEQKAGFYRKIQDYLDKNIEQDQKCFEDCIAFQTLEQQLEQGRYLKQLQTIEKHFTELDEVLYEINI